METSARTPSMSVLLEGPVGTGKTALAASIAREAGFPFLKVISADNMVGMSEAGKCDKIYKVFMDAYKSRLSAVVIDALEQVLEFTPLHGRFSNTVLQALVTLIKRPPPKDHRLLVLATTSNRRILQMMGLVDAFSAVFTTEALQSGGEVLTVLRELAGGDDTSVEADELAFSAREMADLESRLAGVSAVDPDTGKDVPVYLGVKQVCVLAEMAKQAEPGRRVDVFLHKLCEASAAALERDRRVGEGVAYTQ